MRLETRLVTNVWFECKNISNGISISYMTLLFKITRDKNKVPLFLVYQVFRRSHARHADPEITKKAVLAKLKIPGRLQVARPKEFAVRSYPISINYYASYTLNCLTEH